MKLQEIVKHLFGPETRTNEQWEVQKAKMKAEELGELNLGKLFQKTHYQYLNKKEQRQVARIVKRHM